MATLNGKQKGAVAELVAILKGALPDQAAALDRVQVDLGGGKADVAADVEPE